MPLLFWSQLWYDFIPFFHIWIRFYTSHIDYLAISTSVLWLIFAVPQLVLLWHAQPHMQPVGPHRRVKRNRNIVCLRYQPRANLTHFPLEFSVICDASSDENEKKFCLQAFSTTSWPAFQRKAGNMSYSTRYLFHLMGKGLPCLIWLTRDTMYHEVVAVCDKSRLQSY